MKTNCNINHKCQGHEECYYFLKCNGFCGNENCKLCNHENDLGSCENEDAWPENQRDK